MGRILSVGAVVLVALGLAGSGSAGGAKDLRVGCELCPYQTISAALVAAAGVKSSTNRQNIKISISPGKYTENLTLGPEHSGVTLVSEKPLEAVLEGSIEIAAAHDVTVRGLSLTGGCDCPEVAILLNGAKGTNVLDSEVDGFEFGIEVVEGDRGTTLKGNVVSDSTSDGIALYATTGVVVKGNVVTGSGGNGLYADSASTGNTFRANRASGSALFDCRDDSNDGGTSVSIPANAWENNQGTTALPPWICAP